MLKLFYNEKLVIKGGIADLLSVLHQFTQAQLVTHDKENYFLILP